MALRRYGPRQMYAILLTAIVGPDGQRTERGYDANGYLDEVTNPKGGARRARDGFDGPASLDDGPASGVYAFAYDSLGRLVSDSSTLRLAVTTDVSPLGRRVSERNQDETTGIEKPIRFYAITVRLLPGRL